MNCTLNLDHMAEWNTCTSVMILIWLIWNKPFWFSGIIHLNIYVEYVWCRHQPKVLKHQSNQSVKPLTVFDPPLMAKTSNCFRCWRIQHGPRNSVLNHLMIYPVEVLVLWLHSHVLSFDPSECPSCQKRWQSQGELPFSAHISPWKLTGFHHDIQ